MPNLFFFVVVLRFNCRACGRTSEQRGALGVDQNSKDAIGESIRMSGPLCQHCKAPMGTESEPSIEIQQATAQYLTDLGLPIPGGV